MASRRVRIDVGGTEFVTSLQSLKADPDFHKMVFDNELFLDRDPTHFRHVLNYLRGLPTLPFTFCEVVEVYQEANAYGIDGLAMMAKDRIERWGKK